MKQLELRRVILVSIIVLAAAGLLAGPALAIWPFDAKGSFERTLEVTGPVNLSVESVSGSITVRAGEPGQVRVKGEIHARGGNAEEKVERLQANPPIDQDGNTIRIGHIEDRGLAEGVSISYELVVPEETRLESDTGSGSQRIEGIRGPVEADSGSGSLRLSNIGGRVTADTGSGSIKLNSIRGDVLADTGSGSIHATGIAGGFTGDTGSGSVRVEQTAPGAVHIDTGSGSVEVTGANGTVEVETGSGSIAVEGRPTGNWRLDTGSGSVRLRVPPETGFELYARTSTGRIHTELPVTVEGSLNRREVRGTVAGGGPEIYIQTGSGDIRIQ